MIMGRRPNLAATDASGTATATAAYDEYGIPSGGNVGRFGYTGQAFLLRIGSEDTQTTPTMRRRASPLVQR